VDRIDRKACREYAEKHFTPHVLMERLIEWLKDNILTLKH
jgi:hypothetical protein